jgi:YgiT-type zinc finger domain-containing protein
MTIRADFFIEESGVKHAPAQAAPADIQGEGGAVKKARRGVGASPEGQAAHLIRGRSSRRRRQGKAHGLGMGDFPCVQKPVQFRRGLGPDTGGGEEQQNSGGQTATGFHRRRSFFMVELPCDHGGDTMTCFMCKGKTQNSFSTFTTDIGNCIVIIKNVPSQICDQCAEVSYSDDVARRLEQIVNSIKDSALTEIAVVNYTDRAA